MSKRPRSADERVEAINTLLKFYRHLDRNEYESLIRLMHPQGTWHRQGKELQPNDEMRSALRSRPANRRIHHLLFNVIAELTDTGVIEATAYMAVVQGSLDTTSDGPTPFEGLENIRTLRATIVQDEMDWRLKNLKSEPPSFVRAR